MTDRFVNLHIHSEYSALDGYIRIQQMIDKTVEFGQKACALTDHGTLAGTADFYKLATNAGIKPIIGFEAYVCADRHIKPERKRRRKKKESSEENDIKEVPDNRNKHLVLLAKNEHGYHNLLKLHSEGYRHQIQIFARSVPRIDHQLLQQHGKGIIATSACLAGELATLIRNNKYNQAKQLVKFYSEIFDHFFLEVQPASTAIKYANDFTQQNYNIEILRLGKELNVPVIVTTDSHYTEENDRDAHQLLLAIQSKRAISDPCRLTFEAPPMMCERSLSEEFDKRLIYNTEMIAELCEDPTYLRHSKSGETEYKIPPFEVVPTDPYINWSRALPTTEMQKCAANTTDETERYFYYKIDQGWNTKNLDRKSRKAEYLERLKHECDIIVKMGFVSYFLIVADVCEYCDKEKITRGVGRGSVGGSLVGYLMNIHKIDPIKYDLLFERFLNPDRVTMPDIDSDFDSRDRSRVHQYIIDKYGADRVANIATFGRMKVRSCIKDIIRSLELGGSKKEAFKLADTISRSIRGGDEVSFEDITDKENKEAYSFEFCRYMEMYPQLARYVKKYESYIGRNGETHPGIIRQSGIHAAGVIVGMQPLDETIPMLVDKNGVRATAYDDQTLEKLGYLKLDILGLSTLSIISETLKHIKKVREKDLNRFPITPISYIPRESAKDFKARFNNASESTKQATRAFHLLRQGKTSAIFQLEGAGMTNLCIKNRVNSIEDIAAVIALGRPGPLESGDTAKYSERKFGKEKVEYLHPSLEHTLKSTYGICCYQEQVSQIAIECARFSPSDADSLRYCIGKKVKEEMVKFERKFIDGCQAVAKMPKQIAEKLWEIILGFSRYSFNKSHAVCYALTAYQTAFLKANYPAEFWAAVLSNEGSQEKINFYFHELAAIGLETLPVNINESGLSFVPISKKAIRRSLIALNAVGPIAVHEIIAKRPYKSMIDFLKKIDHRKVNIGILLALIKAGAFNDAFESENYDRKIYYDYIEDCRAKLKKASGQQKDSFEYDWNNPVTIDPKTKERIAVEPKSGNRNKRWELGELLQHEIDVYGVPVSGHPFDAKEVKIREKRFAALYKDFGILKLDTSLSNTTYVPGDKVYIFARITGLAMKRAYKRDKTKFMRRLAIEDRYGRNELTVFDNKYDEQIFDKGKVRGIVATVDDYQGRRSLKFDKILPI